MLVILLIYIISGLVNITFINVIRSSDHTDVKLFDIGEGQPFLGILGPLGTFVIVLVALIALIATGVVCAWEVLSKTPVGTFIRKLNPKLS